MVRSQNTHVRTTGRRRVTRNSLSIGSPWFEMQEGFGQVTTPTIVSGRSTGRFSWTLKSPDDRDRRGRSDQSDRVDLPGGELHVLDLHDVLPAEFPDRTWIPTETVESRSSPGLR